MHKMSPKAIMQLTSKECSNFKNRALSNKRKINSYSTSGNTASTSTSICTIIDITYRLGLYLYAIYVKMM